MKAFEEEPEPTVLVQWFCPLRGCCLFWVAVRLPDLSVQGRGVQTARSEYRCASACWSKRDMMPVAVSSIPVLSFSGCHMICQGKVGRRAAKPGSNITKFKSLFQHLETGGRLGGDHWQACFFPCLAGIYQGLWQVEGTGGLSS